MGLFDTIQKIALTPSVVIGNAITSGIGKVTGKTYKKTSVAEAQKTTFGKVLGTSIAATAGALGVAVSGAAVAAAGGVRVISGKAVSAAAPIIAKAVSAAAPIIAKGAAKVITSPTTALKAIAVTGVVAGGGLAIVPKVFQVTKKATQVAVPVITGEKKLTSENVADVAKVAGIVAGAGALAVGAGYVAEKVFEKKEEKAIDTNVIPEVAPGVFEATPEQAQQLQKEKAVGIQGEPSTPETIKLSPEKKRYKRRRATKTPQVRQSVRINILNRPVTTGIRNTTYLKERLYN
jgi:hypothetical protein